MKVTLLPYGEQTILAEVDDLASVLALDAALRADMPEVVLDLVPAARTLLVRGADGTNLDTVRAWIRMVASTTSAHQLPPPAEVITVAVTYDGADLVEVATLTGLRPDQVIDAHTGQMWRVAFGGFAPGFAYLVGENHRLSVPRRASPRTRVPAGAVGLAGEFSGIYPRSSPGGWQLIGRTKAALWDADRAEPALLQPGLGVRFVAVGS
ncbi:MAG: 5-oxoprolinase subunit B family protein [Propioniciclava sp.]